MCPYVLAAAAQRDVSSILDWTHEQFGDAARQRYEALLTFAIQDVVGDPRLIGSHVRPDITAHARTYHLYHSRNRVPAKIGRVRRPRHFLLYRVDDNGIVEIGRVLHDSMDLERHLPDWD